MLEIEVYEIRGRCPVHKIGDKIVIDGPKLLLEKTNAVCIHALSSLLHYVVALDHGVSPLELGLTRSEDREHAYIQCVDPWEPYTHGGTVIYRCRRISEK